MSRTQILFALTLAVALGLGACANKPAPVGYKAQVQPLLDKYCLDCHKPGTPGYEASGFGVEDYAAVMKGTRYGPVVVPGDPLTSNLLVLVEGRASPTIQMPHDGRKLTPAELQVLRSWVEQGAKDN